MCLLVCGTDHIVGPGEVNMVNFCVQSVSRTVRLGCMVCVIAWGIVFGEFLKLVVSV